MSTNTVTPTETAHALCDRIGTRLDQVEESLPTLPAAWLSLNRAMIERLGATAEAISGRIRSDVGRVAGHADTATATVRGQARSGVERVVETAERVVKETAGQTKAQFGSVATDVNDTTAEMVEDAERRVSPTKAQLRRMTKAELYDRAQTLDLDGRSTMSKGELVDAIAESSS